MQQKQASILTRRVIKDGLTYIFTGKLRLKKGYLPRVNHAIPADFFGISVASNNDPATDDYIIEQLRLLGIQKVRLDFSYADIDSFNARFLQALLTADFQVGLHLFPPFEAASDMESANAQTLWADFLHTVLDRYGSQVAQIEIGSTINRKRWAGFTEDGFLIAWKIAHHAVKQHAIKLLGPNIQDFEPLYNISYLKRLRQSQLLPDIQTDNLFVERVSEPERFDHRILKYHWARVFKYNLVKKARLLQKIGQDFGVENTASSAAFWAIYRIERLLVAGEEKQADYLTRYFTLLAASGALVQAHWGALICQREGLISDGLTEADYPADERIYHYKQVDGIRSQYRYHPSFYAMQTVIHYLRASQYRQTIASSQGLEIHHFSQQDKQFHVAWTINGKVVLLSDIYTKNSLQHATLIHRDGTPLTSNTDFITETPLYLVWELQHEITLKTQPKITTALAIHKHVVGRQYFAYAQANWRGLVLAANQNEHAVLMTQIDPQHLQHPQKQQALRHARNVIWAIDDPRKPSEQLTVKQPVKMYPHKQLLDRYKPSKARRSWNGAMELMRRGIGTAAPIAYFEHVDDRSLRQNFYLCEYVKADFNIGQAFLALSQGQTTFLNISAESLYQQFARFCHQMHARGIYFRDLSGGNILVKIAADSSLEFILIDTARLHSSNRPIPMRYRIADLTRACHKLYWLGRKRFLQLYLGLTGRRLTWQYRYPFYLYDLKIVLKRHIGRKAIKRLIKAVKGYFGLS